MQILFAVGVGKIFLDVEKFILLAHRRTGTFTVQNLVCCKVRLENGMRFY
jgi:hypothetical protein